MAKELRPTTVRSLALQPGIDPNHVSILNIQECYGDQAMLMKRSLLLFIKNQRRQELTSKQSNLDLPRHIGRPPTEPPIIALNQEIPSPTLEGIANIRGADSYASAKGWISYQNTQPHKMHIVFSNFHLKSSISSFAITSMTPSLLSIVAMDHILTGPFFALNPGKHAWSF